MDKNFRTEFKFLICSFIFLNLLILSSCQNSLGNTIDPYPEVCQNKNGFWIIPKKSYFFGTLTKVNWYKAFLNCKALGMELLSIESQSEQEIIRNILSANTDKKIDRFWTSGSDLAQEGNWSWYGTGQTFTYKNWARDRGNQPDNGQNGIEHCMELWAKFEGNSEKWTWNDDDCYVESYFICEK